jgi:hypothetical protein
MDVDVAKIGAHGPAEAGTQTAIEGLTAPTGRIDLTLEAAVDLAAFGANRCLGLIVAGLGALYETLNGAIAKLALKLNNLSG